MRKTLFSLFVANLLQGLNPKGANATIRPWQEPRGTSWSYIPDSEQAFRLLDMLRMFQPSICNSMDREIDLILIRTELLQCLRMY